ncbi:MAG: diguanylate cyclase [Solirubrobacteraceae bacterium]|nr:diguanylate cyclase [Solirubrobacteraceae bacterium]
MPTPISDRLTAAPDVSAACWAVVDHLAEVPGALPSVYLERGGRLRCQAVRGYLEILDGLPPTAGIIGRTFRTGEPTVEHDVTRSPDFVEIIGDVVAEACFPIHCKGALVGVVNVESTVPLHDAAVARVHDTAALLGQRLEALGGPPTESPSQRLVRHAARLTGLTKVDEMEREVLDAALDISRMGSAMLLRLDENGAVGARRALGPLAVELESLPGRTLRRLAHSVQEGASRYTISPGDRDRPVVQLPGTKIRTLLALPVIAEGAAREVLLLADRRAKAVTTDEIELLEMLCAQAGSALRVAGLVRELRTQAATDPLTGLGHHRTFHTKLRRLRGKRIAVLLLDLDGFKQINDTFGHQAGDRLLREVAATLSAALRRGDELFRIGGDEFGALLRVQDQTEAMEAAERLVAAAATIGDVTVSIGVAMCEEDEPVESVLGRADRALYDVKQTGRNAAALA